MRTPSTTTTRMKLSLGALLAAGLAGCAAEVMNDRAPIDGDGEGGASGSSGSTGPSAGSGSSGSSGSSASLPDGGVGGVAEATCTKATKRYGALGMYACVPAGMEAKTAEPAALVVALHGYTQGVETATSPNGSWGYKATTEWAKLAQRHRFYVIFPDKGTAAFQWYSFFGTNGIGRSDLEPTSIKSMVDDMRATYNIASDKVFVNGLSAGAYMAVVMLATYPDVFAAGSTFAGGAYGCTTSCAALGKKGQGWTWPGNHAAALVQNAYPTVWKSPTAKKPRLMIFQGDADGAVTPENLVDLTQQWKGAAGISGAGTASTLKGHAYTEYTKDGEVALATVVMAGIGHGTPVDPGTAPDQGGWDPNPSKTASADANAAQDWTNSAGIYGPYYSAKFFGIVP